MLMSGITISSASEEKIRLSGNSGWLSRIGSLKYPGDFITISLEKPETMHDMDANTSETYLRELILNIAKQYDNRVD